jgi:hypothetical protein
VVATQGDILNLPVPPLINLYFYVKWSIKGVFMKIRHLVFILLAAVVVIGCTETKIVKETVIEYRDRPMPVQSEDVTFTPSIYDRLVKMPDFEDISDYQFVLSGQIRLNISDTQLNDRSEPAGKAVFENILIRKEITFENKKPGQAIFDYEEGDFITLHVCFESQQDELKYPSDTHYLVFRARKSEENAFFSLVYNSRRDAPQFSAEKGSLQYGGENYTLLLNEDRPYLMIKLDQKTRENLENRNVPGRIVKTKS